MQVVVLNGVNLSMLGKRDPAVYGTVTLSQLETMIYEWAKDLNLTVRCWQTNSEGDYVDMIHEACAGADGLVVNPGAWTHYSYAIRDALEIFTGADRRGAPLEHRGARGVAASLRDRRRRLPPDPRARSRRLPRGPRAPGGHPVSHAARLAALGERLDSLGVDALLVTARANIRYLTGFGGTNGVALVRPDGATFLTDFRYTERAAPLEAYMEVRQVERDVMKAACAHLAELAPGAQRVGLRERPHDGRPARPPRRRGAGCRPSRRPARWSGCAR